MCAPYLHVFTCVTITGTRVHAIYAHIHVHDEEDNDDESSCPRLCAASPDTVCERTGCTVRAQCTRTRAGARGRATRENTIKAAPGKNTNLNGTKEICSHIRCIRMNGARLLQFTIYCFATFFSADASGIRSLLPVPCRPPRSSHRRPFRRSCSFLLSFSLPLSLFRHRIRGRERDGRVRKGRVSEKGRTGTIREVKPLLPKRIMRGKIKFFSTRPFELHRPRDHALLLLVLYTVYTFRGMRSLSFSPTHRPLSFPSSPPVRSLACSLIVPPSSQYSLSRRHSLRKIETIYERSNSHWKSFSPSDRVSRNASESRIIRVYLNAVGHSASVPRASSQKVRRSCGAGVGVFSKYLR